MERCLLRHGKLPGYDERGEICDGDVQYDAGAICAERGGDWNGHRKCKQRSGGDQLSFDLLGELQQRHGCEPDRIASDGFDVCWMEWCLLGHGKLPGYDERG